MRAVGTARREKPHAGRVGELIRCGSLQDAFVNRRTKIPRFHMPANFQVAATHPTRSRLDRAAPPERAPGRWLLLALAPLLLPSCATTTRRDAVPSALEEKAVVPGYPQGIRYLPRDAEDVQHFKADFLDSLIREEALLREQGHTGPLPPSAYLAISGGGDNGAFGAGFLNGWTKAGTRPKFKLVTGVSTGALMAPFAFLGPDYDERLKALYTGISMKDIATKRSMLAVLYQDAMADSGPLRKLVEKYVTQEMLERDRRRACPGAHPPRRHDQPGCPSGGDLERHQDRGERKSRRPQAGPNAADRFRGDSRNLPAGHDRRRGGGPVVSGDARRRRHGGPGLQLSAGHPPEGVLEGARRASATARSTSSGTPGSIRSGRRSTAAPCRSPSGPFPASSSTRESATCTASSPSPGGTAWTSSWPSSLRPSRRPTSRTSIPRT